MKRYIPQWFQTLVDTIVEDFHVKPLKIVYLKTDDPQHKSGRCFHRQRVIVIKCIDRDCEWTRAIVLHEFAHLLDTRGKGKHDSIFFMIVELLYVRYGISTKTASAIEEIVPRSYWHNDSWRLSCLRSE